MLFFGCSAQCLWEVSSRPSRDLAGFEVPRVLVLRYLGYLESSNAQSAYVVYIVP